MANRHSSPLGIGDPSEQERTKSAEIARLAAAIEAELRDLNVWRSDPPPREVMQYTPSFGGDRMPFETWIQFVLLPHLREAAAGLRELPPCSNLAAYAVREFDGREEHMQTLVGLLGQIDGLSPRSPVEPTLLLPSQLPLRVKAVFLTIIGIWAGICIFSANWIGQRLAAKKPDRVLVSANFAGIGVGPWRGLVLGAWASGAGDQITGETATLTLPPVGGDRASDSVEFDLTKSPPGIKSASGPMSLEYSAGGLASWAAGAPADQRIAVDAVSRAVFQQIEGLRYGAATGKIEQALHQLGEQLGGQSQRLGLVEIRRYPRPVSTAEFFGPFCALFLPPVLVWMIYRHQRNMRRR